jgi:hypothetical protein
MAWKVTGKVNMFPMSSPWYWVGVPQDIALKIKARAPKTPSNKFVPITVKLGKTEWRTALLPLGEGKYFVALKAKVRKAEGITVGDQVSISISSIVVR